MLLMKKTYFCSTPNKDKYLFDVCPLTKNRIQTLKSHKDGHLNPRYDYNTILSRTLKVQVLYIRVRFICM